MPITKSAKKSLRSSITKRDRNAQMKNKFKKMLKEVNEKNLSDVISTVDKAEKRNIITKNKAARIKSRLSKKMGSKKIKPKLTKSNVKKKTKKLYARSKKTNN